MIEIRTDTFALQFTSDGKPASLRMLSGGEELLEIGNPGDGFFLRGKGERSIPLVNISFRDDRLVLSAEYGTPEVTFAVKRTPSYLAFRIERLKAVSVANDLSLHFRMNLKKASPLGRAGWKPAPQKAKQDGGMAKILPLDYMTDAVDNGNGRVDWNHLSHRHPENPLGGFALFCPTSAEDSDETVLQIWAGENLPHPKIEGEWNLEAARKWVAAWGRNFADESRLWLDASSLEELYEGARYAEMADVKEIYLFTNVWRGEPFWPEHKINWNINREVFPNGEADVRAYSDYLKSKGISLKIHYVSGGIGHYDPMYIGKQPDRRLASWGKGSLVETINADDTTIRFRPDPGVELPYRMPGDLYGYLPSRSWAFQNIFDYEIMRIENELIYVGSFDDTDQEVWTLRGCKRGLFTTDASRHAGGVDLTGIITTYGVNFIPENDSTLLREVAENFAGMLTRCGIVHTEYDGAEIHTYNGRMWGWEKFATIVYEGLDQPVTALSSSGRPPCCHLEYKMSFAHDPARGRWLAAYLITHQPSRVASTLLDAHYEMSQAAATGVNCFNVMKPEPLFGIKLDTLRNHGLTSRVLEAVRDWKAVSRLMTQEQREEILKTRDNTGVRPNQIGRFPSSTLTHRLRKFEDRYEIVPVHVLRREVGDIKWFSGGEHGPISPRQYVKLGDALKLNNAFPAQPAQFIIRVMWGTDYEEKSGPVPSPQLGDLRWICFAQEGVRANEDLSEKYFFRKEFELSQDSPIADACFSFAVDDHLVLYINGRKVDEGGDRERMTDWNVTRFLQPGRNVIAAVASNSNGLIVAGLAARLTAELADGQSRSVESDKSWKSTSGEVPEEWKSCGFDDSAWSPVFAAEETSMSNIVLQPRLEEIQDRRDTTITQDGDALVFSASNARDEAIWEETKLPCWDQRIDMRRHRGIGMHVTGDGSGAILVFQIPGRDYVVPIDFTGRRYVEIPNGEAAWFEARWGWRMGSKSTQYGGVRQCKLGFGHIASRTDVKVKVEGLKALVEIPTELADPVIRTGDSALAIKGSVSSGQYLVYEGGDTAGVYDQNWHLLKELDVEKSDYVVPNGWSDVSVTGEAKSTPWLEVQFMTEGEAMIVKDEG